MICKWKKVNTVNINFDTRIRVSYHFTIFHYFLFGIQNVIFKDTGCQFQVEVATSSALYYWNKHVFIDVNKRDGNNVFYFDLLVLCFLSSQDQLLYKMIS